MKSHAQTADNSNDVLTHAPAISHGVNGEAPPSGV